jgi:ribosomal protein S18 acetylase RimI-like enzyme
MSTVFSLRRATAEDHQSIQRVYFYIVGPPTLQERTWSRLIREGYMVVAEVDTQVVGFGGIDIDAAEQLKWLYVLPEYQSYGIGSKILKELEDIGWMRGLIAIRLHAAPDAFEFYRKHGYRRIEERVQVVHDHDGVEMIKDRG